MVATRQWHATTSAYPLPNDAPENERLNLQTRDFNEMMHGKAFHAPVDQPSRVLEVGAGTGYVTRFLASTFPQAEVIGLDLSTVPAGEKTKAIFIQGDVMDDGVVSGPFDSIYSRMLVYGGIRSWPAYIARAWDLLAPGGWLETQEVDTSAFFDGDDKNMYPDSSWRNEQRVAFEAKGIDMACATKLEKYFEGHPETLNGARCATKYNPAVIFESYKRMLGHTKTAAQLDVVREEINKEFACSEDGKHRDYYVVCGRKPGH